MKRCIFLSFMVISLLLVTGCTFYRSVTFTVETGDKVEIKLDASDGYSITTNLPFAITKDDNVVTEGAFLTLDEFEQFKETILNNEESTIIDQDDEGTYIFFNYKDTEYDYLIKLPRSNTALVLKNEVSIESAEEVLDRLTITVIKEQTKELFAFFDKTSLIC